MRKWILVWIDRFDDESFLRSYGVSEDSKSIGGADTYRTQYPITSIADNM